MQTRVIKTVYLTSIFTDLTTKLKASHSDSRTACKKIRFSYSTCFKRLQHYFRRSIHTAVQQGYIVVD